MLKFKQKVMKDVHLNILHIGLYNFVFLKYKYNKLVACCKLNSGIFS